MVGLRGILKRQSFTVQAAPVRLGRAELDAHLSSLGDDGRVAADLDDGVDAAMAGVRSLSPLTERLAEDYMDRLGRPIPSLTSSVAIPLVARAYIAHMQVEADPARFGATDVPVLGTLPPPKKGRPPQDLLSRVVKASRGKNFQAICALTPAAWDGFVHCLTKRAHDQVSGEGDRVSPEVVDGVARFAWVLRQVDLHYGLEPARP